MQVLEGERKRVNSTRSTGIEDMKSIAFYRMGWPYPSQRGTTCPKEVAFEVPQPVGS